ncbi:PepSY domain-containing protein [Labrys miyagiensis]
MKEIAVALLAAALFAGPAFAQSDAAAPPANGKKLSELISKVETRDKFLYISQIDWSTSGYYEVIYYTSDKAKVELHLDAMTGEPK